MLHFFIGLIKYLLELLTLGSLLPLIAIISDGIILLIQNLVSL